MEITGAPLGGPRRVPGFCARFELSYDTQKTRLIIMSEHCACATAFCLCLLCSALSYYRLCGIISLWKISLHLLFLFSLFFFRTKHSYQVPGIFCFVRPAAAPAADPVCVVRFYVLVPSNAGRRSTPLGIRSSSTTIRIRSTTYRTYALTAQKNCVSSSLCLLILDFYWLIVSNLASPWSQQTPGRRIISDTVCNGLTPHPVLLVPGLVCNHGQIVGGLWQ